MKYTVTLYRVTEEFVEVSVETQTVEEAVEAAKKKSWRATWAMLSSYVRNAVVVKTDGEGKQEAVNVELARE